MSSFKVIIAGGTLFRNAGYVASMCDTLLACKENVEIVSGGAPGTDYYGIQYAKKRQLRYTVFPAKWDKYSKKAGPIRNTEMSKYADALIAFWNGESKGTADMIRKARAKGLEVRVIRVNYPKKA